MTDNRTEMHLVERYRPDGAVSETDTLYFKVISNSPHAQRAGAVADQIYQGILADIKLTESMRPYSLYPFYLYLTRNEYFQKSGMPEWSAGVFNKSGILIYEHRGATETLAHEISHLIFWEFFGNSRPDLLWLNEGIAMREEALARPDKGQDAYSLALPALKGAYLPLAELTATPTALNHKDKDAQIFYIESWLLTGFLIEQGGRVGFYEFLRNLKDRLPLDAAIGQSFPGKWSNLNELENSFKAANAIVW
ncbi:MAG: hypothetical protein HY547_06255 [Elusimicrobia bacterium]|nr:hypothetical protein [Elusimicrobiota bacterium]